MAVPPILIQPASTRAIAVEAPDVPPLAVLPVSTQALEIEPVAEPVEVELLVAPRGAPGRDGEALQSFEMSVTSPAASWTVNHNLGRKPAAVSVRSPGGLEVIAEVLHLSVNQLLVSFAAPQTGSVVVQ